MTSFSPPTPEQIQRLQAQTARPESRAYFFDRLENPLWLGPLRDVGFFANPPAPEPAEEPGYVRFPPWPEGRYLARVAAQAPDDARSVLLTADAHGNPAVVRLLLDAALALPADQLSELVPQVSRWVSTDHAEYFAESAASLIARLIEEGEVTAAFETTAQLLEVQAQPLREVYGGYHSRPEARGRISDWEYEQVLERLREPLLRIPDIAGLTFVSDLMMAALHANVADDSRPDIGSSIWRPAIEDHDQNHPGSVRGMLISATRDIAVGLAAQGEGSLREVVEYLDSQTVVHRRVALHVLAVTPGGSELADRRIRETALFDDGESRHEYAALLRARFRSTSEEVQAVVLDWIRGGPDVEDYRQWREADGVALSEREIDRYVRVWKRDRYSVISDSLAPEDQAAYAALLEDVGDPEHADFTSWMEVWHGPESPLDSAQIGSMSPQQVLDYVRAWRPEPRRTVPFGPSIDGLGAAITEDVKKRTRDYSELAPEFRQLDPTYARSLLHGLHESLKQGGDIAWGPVLVLGDFVAAQTSEPDLDQPDRDRDPGWSWGRRQLASLLQAGCQGRENGIPIEFRPEVWDQIVRLLDDPSPSVEYESEYGGDNMDPLMLSLNSNRGAAMHAVMEYALWVKRSYEARSDEWPGFDAIPEVREVLDRHLNLAAEPSIAVRAVYGRWLPWLLLLDERWVAERKPELFPTEPQLAEFRAAVWDTYVSWNRPYDSSFRALGDEYSEAVAAVPSGRKAQTRDSDTIDVKVGEHIVTYWCRGVAEEKLVDDFFERADDDTAAQVMEDLGWSLKKTTGDVLPDIASRMQALWDKRLAVGATDPEAHAREMRAFGNTFAAAKLDGAWAIESLEHAILLGGAPKPAQWLVDRLAVVAESRPADAARILDAMLQRVDTPWAHVGWSDHARAIAALALRSNDPTAVQHGQSIVDFFVKRGELAFRDLLM